MEKARNLPNRWAQRIAPFVDDAAFAARTAFPGLKNIGAKKAVQQVAPKVTGLAKVLPIASQIFGGIEGTRRLMGGADPHQVALGYGYALPGPWGWANAAVDIADRAIPGNVDIDATQKGLEKYGFDDGFELGKSNADGSIPVVRSDVGKAEDFLQSQKDEWLAKTANSPAARSMTHGQPTFSEDERWALQQKHRQWLEDNNRT